MIVTWSWKEGLRFALAKELLAKKDAPIYTMSSTEKFGSWIVRPLYEITAQISKYIRKPLAICLFTVLSALIATLIFYNIPTFMLFGKIFPSKTVRFVLFSYIEINFFALGCRAYGRFNNKELVKLWKAGSLISIFPGDKK
jgi:succinate-acetate transporter protein